MSKIELEVFNKLVKHGYKIVTCESLTGGLLAATLINVPGASNIIDMSFVTYSNEAKMEIANVKKENGYWS